MVNVSRIKSLPLILGQQLQQPAILSLLLSIGIHGAIFVLLPIFSLATSDTNEPEGRRPVSIVELTPQEQQRLPDFSAVAPPDLPPHPDDLYSFAPLPSPPPVTPLPSYSIPDYLRTFPFSSSPSPTPAPKPAATPAPRPTATPSATPTPTPSPTTSPGQQTPGQQTPGQQTPGQRSPRQTEQPSASRSEQRSPNAPTIPQSGVQPATPNRDQLESDDRVSTAPTASPSPTGSPPPRTRDQQTAALLQEQRQMRALYNYNGEGTGQAAATAQLRTWTEDALQNWLGEDRPIEDVINDEVRLTGAYPRVACLRNLRGRAIVGVAVDPEGKVVDEPEPIIIESSGYGIFNQLALETVRNYEDFEATGEKQIYLIPVTFQPTADTCPPQSRRTPPTQRQDS